LHNVSFKQRMQCKPVMLITVSQPLPQPKPIANRKCSEHKRKPWAGVVGFEAKLRSQAFE